MAKLDVFLSWSGRRSRCVANRLREWLPGIVPEVRPFFSSEIDAGSAWSPSIAAAVRKSRFAILCITKENLAAPWLFFEAGALWRGNNDLAVVCPLLLDLEPSDLPGPLALFQAKQFTEQSFKELSKTLAKKTRLDVDRFRYNFKAVWPNLDRDVRNDLRTLAGPRRPQKRLQPAARR